MGRFDAFWGVPVLLPGPEEPEGPQPEPAPEPEPEKPVEPAPFPSRLRCQGRTIVDENGYVVAGQDGKLMRGFNVQVPANAWPQSHFEAMVAKGASPNGLCRVLLFWDLIQPNPGKGGIDMDYVERRLDVQIRRIEAAGMYLFPLWTFSPNAERAPEWTERTNRLSNGVKHGKDLVEFLAYRYGNPDSPQYTKAVIGFGISEPAPEDANARDRIAVTEVLWRTFIGWFRALAPDWIAVLQYGYGAASLVPDLPGAGQERNTFDAASPTAFDSVGGNFCVDIHHYFMASASPDPNHDGRQRNGITREWTPCAAAGNRGLRVDNPVEGSCPDGDYDLRAYPPRWEGMVDRERCKAQQRAFLHPYKVFCEQANVPLMIGEFGWPARTMALPGGGTELVDDWRQAWSDAGHFSEIYWDFGVSQDRDKWAAFPGTGGIGVDSDGWQSVVNHWLST